MWQNQVAPGTLLIPLAVIICQLMLRHMLPRSLTQQEHLLLPLLLDGAPEAFTVGIEIRIR